MALRIESMTIDAVDPRRSPRSGPRPSTGVSASTRTATSGSSRDEDHAEYRGEPVRSSSAGPEAKPGKNRVHFDLRPDDQEREVERLEALGATRLDIGQSGSESWVVLADPEGNEFCVLDRSRTDRGLADRRRSGGREPTAAGGV